MVRFYKEGFGDAPVRVTLYFSREELEEIEQAAMLLGYGTAENMIRRLALKTVEELKEAGCKIKPFWEAD